MAEQPPSLIETALAKLRSAHDALDAHLGDTDASDFETEEEEREIYPGQWAARTVMEVIDLLATSPVTCASALQIRDGAAPAPLLLKGVGKIAGDGWKDTTTIGEVVYAWNREMPEPYKAGQFPRLGNPIYTASTEQYDFTPCSQEQAIAAIDLQLGEARRQVNELREQLGNAHATCTIKRIGDRSIAELRFNEKLSAAELKDLVDAMRNASVSMPLGQAVAVEPLAVGLDAVLAEVERATRKFPTWPDHGLHAVAILGEEFGELTRAMLQMVYEPHKVTADDVAEEAIQTAAMALRLVMSLGRYRYERSEQHSQGGTA